MTILFDSDGTLIDSTEAIVESFFWACDEYGFKRPEATTIHSLIGYPLDVMFAQVGVQEDVVWDFVAAYKRHYRKISKQKTVLLPYAKEAVDRASQFARLGIVTTKTARYSRELMEHFGVMGYFEVLIGREDVTHPKPHPEPVLKALEVMGIKAGIDVVLIGDTKLDLEAAKRAGIGGVGVLSGYGSKEELEVFSFPVVEDVTEAVTLLKKAKK